MEITKKQNEKHLTLLVSGRLDTNTAPLLDQEIQQIGDISELTLDLEDLEYISSAGLRVLLVAQKLMKEKGKMEIVNAKPQVIDIFTVTGFIDILNIKQ